ncbi:MAG: hypothetical protein GC131_05035 [Alphaproteobacteria bacterium]|nr:hypothetical protein [Alphaproteobacteria bacterium]
MKKVWYAMLFVIAFGIGDVQAKSTSVHGHMNRNGTYVMPHQRTTPDSNRFNNWSSKGNTNPYTGKSGTQEPFAIKPYKRSRR